MNEHLRHNRLLAFFTAGISLAVVVSTAVVFSVALHYPRIRFISRASQQGHVLGVSAYSANDLDNDGYTSIGSGGSDCYDSLQANYSDGTGSCNSTASATTFHAQKPNPLTDFWIADHTWMKDDNGLWHMFFQNSDNAEKLEHFTSINLTGDLTYVDQPTGLLPGVGTWDEQIWAPHVIKNGNTYYMFYAGITNTGNGAQDYQRIGLATSTSLNGPWEKAPSSNTCDAVTGAGCVYNCNEAWTYWNRGQDYDRSCRDPFVIRDEANSRWIMLATARLSAGGCALSDGVIAATSTNLTQWTGLGYIKATRRLKSACGENPIGTQDTGGIAENPFLISHNGTYYLYFTDWSDSEASYAMIQYATASSLTFDSNGSANWSYGLSTDASGSRGHHAVKGVNATEFVQPYPDVWIASESMSNGNVGSQFVYRDLIWHRIVWNDDGTYTTSKLSKLSCRVPSSSIHPAASEICSDNVDENCSGTADEALYCAACVDTDNDGYGVQGLNNCTHQEVDCGDNDATVNPGATEICDSKDNDCDSSIDEGNVCPAPACAEVWSCGGWSTCSSGSQTRNCTDANACGTTSQKPTVQQACTSISTSSVGASASSSSAVVTWTTNLTADSRVRYGTTSSYGSVATSPLLVVSHSITLTGLTPGTVYHYEVSSTGNALATSIDKSFTTTSSASAPIAVPPPAPEQETRISVIAVAPKAGKPPTVKLFKPDGTIFRSFSAYSTFFRGGVNLAMGDVDGDGKDDIITAPASGTPTVRIFDLNGRTKHLDFLGLPSSVRTGVNIAVGDLNGDGKDEIVTSPMGMASPVLHFFSITNGRVTTTFPALTAYEASQNKGISIAVADVDGRNPEELVVVPEKGGIPRVRIFGERKGVLRQVIPDFWSNAKTFTGGVNLATGDLTGGGQSAIITTPSSEMQSIIRLFVRKPNGAIGVTGTPFLAFHPAYRGGVDLAGCELNADSRSEIVTAVASTGNPLIRIYGYNGKAVFREFLAFPVSYQTGVTVACGTYR